MKIIFSSKCLEYKRLGHPESPERVKGTHLELKEQGYDFVEPMPCSEDDLLLVHDKFLVDGVKKGKGYVFNSESSNLLGIYDYARLSAGSAIKAAELSLSDEASFSLMRPPGHHATKSQLGGFCYFNNIAVAVARFLDRMERVAIIDFDVHFGNGTADIFDGNKNILYVSLHQSPLYPGTGLDSTENCRNYPLKPWTGEKEYLQTFETALGDVEDFNPKYIAISAGFDACDKETIAQLKLKETTYRRIGEMIAELERPSFAVLEGGYANLAACVVEFLRGWSK